MKRHVNIPIFIPHLGCPNQCVFCNQRSISGVQSFRLESVKEQIDDALHTIGDGIETEIAFFGGSFTGIDRNLMIDLLKIAYSYIECGRVSCIRCSTRPDYIDDEILSILKKYGVKVIELGLQSASPDVLSATKRGHNFEDEINACRLIVERGFDLVGQMMIGLPMATEESEIKTADFIIEAGAKGARIYPTVVFKDTELCRMTYEGEYKPLDEREAIRRSANVMRRFIDAGVDVIRVGLCASENLSDESTYVAGPNHSALGELVINEIYYHLLRDLIIKENLIEHKFVTILVSRGSTSKAIGQKRRNIIRLKQEFKTLDIKITECDELSDYSIKTER